MQTSGDNYQSPYWLLIGIVMVLGTLVRLLPVTGASFPLSDGGLFYAMARDIQAEGFRLPAITSYNQQSIPFAYPPLALYLAALLDSVTRWSLMNIVRLLPVIASVLTLGAFFLLARDVLRSRLVVVFAVLAFALLPESFHALVMGGGLTRSVGFLFSLLALQQTFRLYTRHSRWHLPLAILLSGATVLSHPEQAWFLAYSTVILSLAKGRSRQGLINTIWLGLGVLAVTAPWWATVASRHGIGVFLSATSHGWPITNGLLQLLLWGGTQETLVPVLGFLALLGVVSCAMRREFWLPVWALAIFLLDSWMPATMASIPIALLAGIGMGDVLYPLLTGEISFRRQASEPTPRPTTWLVVGAVAAIVIYAALSALVTGNLYLHALSGEERDAMAWVAANTSKNSSFLVVTGDRWGDDRSAEWFPVLAERRSVTTVQGSEWLGNGEFARRVRQSETLRLCAARNANCLEQLIGDTGTFVTHIYVPKRAATSSIFQRPGSLPTGNDCCWSLRASLNQNPRYALLYDGPGAAVFEKIIVQ